MLKITQNHVIRPYICYTYTIRRKDIMKKIFKLAVCLLTVVGLSACGGASTEKQEAVVKSFFDYLKAGDIEKLSTVCTEDNSDVDDLVSMMASFEEFQDVATYGQTFVDEANKFIDSAFQNYVTSYEINSVEEDGDNYLVIVDVKMKDYDNIDLSSETNDIVEKYQTEHLSELQEIYLSQGEQAMMEKIFGDMATEIFGAMTKEMEGAKDIDTQLRFTLVPNEDNWLISKIEQKSE